MAGLGVGLFGVALCLLLDYYWQTKLPAVEIVGGGYPSIQPPRFNSVSGDLLIAAAPFYVLGIVVALSRVRLMSVAISLVAITGLTVFEYRTNATSDGSTAAVVFVWSWFAGIPLAMLPLALDAGADALRARRHGLRAE